jgi:hypothetical protein
MATRNAIEQLSQRIDALALRCSRRTLNCLPDGVWRKLEVLAGSRIGPCRPSSGTEQWSTDELIRFLTEAGVLTGGDFKGATNGHTLCG